MSKQIRIDPNIQDLVRGLNQIQGVETSSSCDGHGGMASVSFDCPLSTAICILGTAMRHQGFGMSAWSIEKRGVFQRHTGIGLNPRWVSRTLTEMQKEFLEDLDKSGLRTEECQFEILSPLSIAEARVKWQPDFDQALVTMTPGKFELIKNFLYVRWCRRLEAYMGPTRRLPNLSGNAESGEFYCCISYKRRPSNLRMFNGVLCDVRWRECKMVISLHQSYYNNPFKEGPLFEIRCLKDIEGIQFDDDDIITLIEALLE